MSNDGKKKTVFCISSLLGLRRTLERAFSFGQRFWVPMTKEFLHVEFDCVSLRKFAFYTHFLFNMALFGSSKWHSVSILHISLEEPRKEFHCLGSSSALCSSFYLATGRQIEPHQSANDPEWGGWHFTTFFVLYECKLFPNLIILEQFDSPFQLILSCRHCLMR